MELRWKMMQYLGKPWVKKEVSNLHYWATTREEEEFKQIQYPLCT